MLAIAVTEIPALRGHLEERVVAVHPPEARVAAVMSSEAPETSRTLRLETLLVVAVAAEKAD